jgi:two-component system, cell cycle response regulator DivK
MSPRRKRILVVEDNEIHRRLFNEMLRESGHVVVMAETGASAIKLAQQGERRKPHLILLDVRLPDISGLDVARVLKSAPSTCNIPIIAVTAYAMPGDEQKVMQSGCDAYVSKPIKVIDLLALVETFLSRPRSRLPPAGLANWSAAQKAAVVIAVRSGILGRSAACERYMLSEEELSQWEEAFNRDGLAGLLAKNHSRRRPRKNR